ncbi:MAG TPA: alpha/beta fold hydrolase [Terrimesophilobacter sp.]|nr:alpha/beta fold hydrolase [Terrimesophilobacter sp.]
MVSVRDIPLPGGRWLRVHDSAGGAATGGFTVVWHHGSPQTGAILAPLLSAADARGIRLISYGRPSYGGSTARPGRDVASAASDVGQIADALGVGRFAVMGASGGGPHALACAALLAERVTAAVCLASPAPFTGDGAGWFAGMASDGGLRAAAAGRSVREIYAQTDEFDPDSFTESDYAALEGTWSALGDDARSASTAGSGGLVDDDLAFVAPWGFDVSDIRAPVLLVQGGQDRVIPPAHAEVLLRQCTDGELWIRPNDGHISILDACPLAMDWLLAHSHYSGGSGAEVADGTHSSHTGHSSTSGHARS